MKFALRLFHAGGIGLGIGADNNNSGGTFYEGAIVARLPSDEVEQAVFQNVRSVGYGEASVAGCSD